MHDPVCVRLGERLGDLCADAGRLVRRQRTQTDHPRQGSALHELHDDPVGVALVTIS